MDIYAKFDVIVSILLILKYYLSTFPDLQWSFRHCLQYYCHHTNMLGFSSYLKNLAAEKTYNNLDVSVSQALKHRAEVCTLV